MIKVASSRDVFVCPNRKSLLKPANNRTWSPSVKCAKHCEKGDNRPEDMTGLRGPKGGNPRSL